MYFITIVLVFVSLLDNITDAFLQCTNNNNYLAPVLGIRTRFLFLSSTNDNYDSMNSSEDSSSTVTYYSPNIPLDDSRWSNKVVASKEKGSSNDNDIVDDNTFNEYSFFDEAIIYVRAGSGGQGANTYKVISKNRKQNGPPDGGNGGRGGNVILQVDKSLNTLAGLTNAWRPNSFGGSGAAASSTKTLRPKSFRAENGQDGNRQYKSGRSGDDVIIRVPPGTVVQEQILNENNKVINRINLGILNIDDEKLIVANGGEGGEGTAVQGKTNTRRPRIPPSGGERKQLKLTLKIVADIALVGVPNAGKSTFLAAVTRAKPKIASYPFTTIIPNLGVWIPPNNDDDNDGNTITTTFNNKGAGSDGLVICDVPGLIAGAAHGIGLGHAFLRHVERCHVIVHLIDATSHDPIADYKMLNEEIIKYQNSQLATMPQVVVVNKIDTFDNNSNNSIINSSEVGLQVRWSREKLESHLREVMPHSRLMWMSAKERDGVDDLMSRLAAFVKKVKYSKKKEEEIMSQENRKL